MDFHLLFIPIALLLSTLIYATRARSKPGSIKKLGLGRVRVPPGPPGWPVVGNLFQFSSSGKAFFEYARDLKAVYGPIFTLRMGTRTMVIISSPELAHEALLEKGLVFATRPAENPTRNIFSCNKFTVNAALHGPTWRSLRRNMVQNMLSSSRLKEFKELREAAMDKLVDRLRAEAEASDGAVSVLKNARFAVFCILLAMCFGVDMDEETIERMDQMMKLVLITLDPRIDDYLPILRPFFHKQRKNALEVRQKQIDTLVPFIERRRAIIRDPGSDPKAVSFSYLDTIFDMKIENRKASLSDPEIVTLCSEFINGGTDTTATAVEWAIARLIETPLYEEIRATVGPTRKVDEKDINSMPFLQAFTKELLRKHPPTYFSLTHAVTEQTSLGGYDIFPGQNVEIFLPGISEDPGTWADPKKFDPDRFFTGREDADITGTSGVKMIPFGAGRRICPGLSMAMVHVNLMIARMVQEFEWSSYPQGTKVDFGEKLEFTVVMKKALRAKITPRP
ncbi:hypothetical protein V2J09_013577 [Rumex salicifolius]